MRNIKQMMGHNFPTRIESLFLAVWSKWLLSSPAVWETHWETESAAMNQKKNQMYFSSVAHYNLKGAKYLLAFRKQYNVVYANVSKWSLDVVPSYALAVAPQYDGRKEALTAVFMSLNKLVPFLARLANYVHLRAKTV